MPLGRALGALCVESSALVPKFRIWNESRGLEEVCVRWETRNIFATPQVAPPQFFPMFRGGYFINVTPDIFCRMRTT